MFTYTVEGWQAYAAAILLVALATVVRAALDFTAPNVVPFAIYFPAILFTTLIGGWVPGALSATLTVLVAWFAFMPPEMSFEIADTSALINIPLFLASAAILIWLAESYRRLVVSLQQANEQRNLLLKEMRHRATNSITVTRSIVENSLKTDTEAAKKIMSRLEALMAFDHVVTGRDRTGEQLSTIVADRLRPYGEDRVSVHGTDIVIEPARARNWALIIHELATNAAKYGALSVPSGSVSVSWTVHGDVLHLTWVESGGQGGDGRNSSDVPSSGFGTKLIDAMTRSLGGNIERSFEAGFRCLIRAPLAQER